MIDSEKTINAWYERAGQCRTREDVEKLEQELINGYSHDYSSSAEAAVACILAEAWHMSSELGLTGFQAGCIGLRFLSRWSYSTNRLGLRIVDFDNLLWPQYSEYFRKRITDAEWERLKQEASKLLSDTPNAAQNVKNHWQRLADGYIPFGYELK